MRRYRYALERRWGDGPAVLFVVLNPSTADGEQDDPTIRRCVGFARAWGYGALLVANLFAYRATDPAELPAMPDAVGRENDEWIRRLGRRAPLIVAAWGARDGWHPRSRHRGEVRRPDARAGVTRSGAARHPLCVRADVELVPFPAPGEREEDR